MGKLKQAFTIDFGYDYDYEAEYRADEDYSVCEYDADGYDVLDLEEGL